MLSNISSFQQQENAIRQIKTQESVTHAHKESSQWKLSKWVSVLDLAKTSKMPL